MERCDWAVGELMVEYHDKEWGIPVHDDKKLFELLVLEGMQAGLSWSTVLNKRKNYRKALDRFDFVKISRYKSPKLNALLKNPGIIRNRAKINSIINNSRKFLEVRKEFGTFDRYVWKFAEANPNAKSFRKLSDLPYSTPVSEAMSKDLKKRGFNFVGPSVCYSFMQATGMVNDHLVKCFLHKSRD
ncbi:MAG: DNA-3-methyladenine glycosylase I [Candidatus Micrarchaeota archaeon]|nr:DNA-3-methyladenine glycosylase I [Candidatus Micrarchaeota archaeon]